MQLLINLPEPRSNNRARYIMLHLPMIIAFVAIVLWTIAHSPFIFKFSPLAFEFNTYVAVICGVYLLQWLAFIMEIRYLELRSRRNRICAYVILLIGNSFLPVWQILEITRLSFHGLILTLWGILSWVSFLPVLFLTFRSDRDLPFGVRMTPFAFSVLGALTSWLWSISI